MVIIY